MAESAAIRRLLLLQRHDDRNRLAWIHAVVQVIPVVIADVNIVSGIPVRCPVLRPRVNHHERIAAVLEAGITSNYNGLAPDAKPMFRTEVETETVLRNVVTAIAAALRPGAMIGLPI